MVAAFERQPELMLLHSDARIIDESEARTADSVLRLADGKLEHAHIGH